MMLLLLLLLQLEKHTARRSLEKLRME